MESEKKLDIEKVFAVFKLFYCGEDADSLRQSTPAGVS